MDHKSLIASLPDQTRRALCAQSDGPGLVRLAGHLGLVAGLAIWVGAGWTGWPIALIPLGILLVFLFTPLHETIHGTAFRTGWLNQWVARLTGFLVVLPPGYFRYFHMAHHRFTHVPGKDPELEGKRPANLLEFLAYLSGIPEFIDRFRVVLTNAIRPNPAPWIPARGRRQVQREAVVFTGCYLFLVTVSLIAGSTLLIWVWLVPLLIGGPFLRVYLLAEHGLCAHVANMFENTRTTGGARIVRWLTWNMPFHAEHHAYPAVPFHKLPAFHALTAAHLRETAPGHGAFAARYLRDPAAPHNA